ncbi:MAG: DUF4149 domain-containing protein [Pyrinomonadaceae bacterium]
MSFTVEENCLMKIIAKLELLLIAMWLGAACFFSFATAPSAFVVLPTTDLAGNLVNRTLMILNVSGLIIGLLVLVTSFIPRNYGGAFWAWARRFFLFLMVVGCGGGQFVVGYWIALLRLQIGKPVDQLAATDPMKIRFDQLHQASVWVLMAAMAAALIAYFFISKRESEKKVEKVDPDFDFTKDLRDLQI